MLEFLQYRIGAIALGLSVGLLLGYLKILRRYLRWRSSYSTTREPSSLDGR